VLVKSLSSNGLEEKSLENLNARSLHIISQFSTINCSKIRASNCIGSQLVHIHHLAAQKKKSLKNRNDSGSEEKEKSLVAFYCTSPYKKFANPILNLWDPRRSTSDVLENDV
jgi:hypothetical protein